ncbi:MAG: acyl--CoA ligase [Deltaproteobacteria bacterium]|nr:acyl--CoA ligase [Deltaproteobacteria bacterium]
MAKKAATVIRNSGCKRGDCFANCFGANHPHDLVFRVASVMTGTTPVTINWQADSIEEIFYKIELAETKLVITDSHFNPGHVRSIKRQFRHIPVCDITNLDGRQEIGEDEFCGDMDKELTRIIVFTSGTTGRPKGVQLPYRAFQTNRSTFELFLEIKEEHTFAVLIVNPLHHANSTAMTDWALRRPGSHIHLIERYSRSYWKILAQVASRNYDRLVAPTVARHFDLLEDLRKEDSLPVDPETLKDAMKKTDFLIGSAPVGPTTIRRLQHYGGRIPNVRFGATETCLQVVGIPRHFSEKNKLKAFQKGWGRHVKGEERPGYYIGRPHHPYTKARVVESMTPGHKGYMKACEMGQEGYLITRGRHVMSGYIKEPEETRKAFNNDWYVGLKDICFVLENDVDGGLDYYWVSRESTLLIRGGVNYAYDHIHSELINFVATYYHLPKDSFDIAVVGIKVDSEHEDSCCVTMETKNQKVRNRIPEIQTTFKELATKHVSKGARPDYVRFATIPRNFKGAVLVKELTSEFREWLGL